MLMMSIFRQAESPSNQLKIKERKDIWAKRIRATAEAKLDPEWGRACAMANDLKSKDGTVLWALSFIHAWEDAVKMIKEAL